ncbi:MAG: LysR family transcriptional regulator [Clostridia bacterium]|nr:LysR family transcriptional regulator [Clostridia bacterium]
MDIQKLKYFYEAARLQHITKAAENLHIAQPALTQAIHQLEKELDVPLFIKNGRNIVLTPYGEHLKNRLEEILPQIEKLPYEINQMKGEVNRTIKLNILAASNFVIESIVKFRKAYPDVIFDFDQTIHNHGYDIVVSTNGVKDTTTRQNRKRVVMTENIYLAVPKMSKYSSYKSISLEEVRDEYFVMLSSSRLFGMVCNKFCSSVGFTPKVLFESDAPSAVKNIVSTGAGIAFWPEYSWGDIQNDEVVLLPIKSPTCKRELIFDLYPNNSDYSETFYNFLINSFEG